jgi:hypothetical protein
MGGIGTRILKNLRHMGGHATAWVKATIKFFRLFLGRRIFYRLTISLTLKSYKDNFFGCMS